MLLPGAMEKEPWKELSNEISIFYQTAGMAELENGRRTMVWAVDDLDGMMLDDDFHIYSQMLREGEILTFDLNNQTSQATVHRHTPDTAQIMQGRDVLVGGVERMSPLLAQGFSRLIFLRAKSVEDVQRAHDLVKVLVEVEGRHLNIQSNLRVLRELERVRGIQAQSLLWVTVGSCIVLGLVFGSLAWMEFREERYLLSLIRSFGVGRVTLLIHAILEHCLLSVGGVLIGFGLLQAIVSRLDLSTLKIKWLGSTAALYGAEGRLLLLGALAGGVLACLPIAIGLRKPLGLVLK
ncbi:MAG: hypothetical protein QM680_06150 [Luteolibacter sp.]